MLADEGRAAAEPDQAIVRLHERAGVDDRPAELGVVQLGEELPGLEVAVGELLRGVVDRRDHQHPFHRCLVELHRRLGEEEPLDRRHEPVDLILVEGGVVVVRPIDAVEKVVAEPLLGHPLHQALEAGYAGRASAEAEGDETIFARPDLPLVRPPLRTLDGVPGARPLALDSLQIELRRPVVADELHRLVNGDVDVLALAVQIAVPQGHQGGVGGLGAGMEIGGGHLARHGRPVGVTREEHVAAHGHRDEVGHLEIAVRSGLSEGRQGDDDDVLLYLRQVIVSQPKAGEVSGRKALQHQVELPNETLEQVLAVGGGQIEGDASLAGVVGPPVEALLGVGIVAVERGNVARGVAFGRLDLDHVGAHVAQNLTGQLPLGVGEIENAKLIKKARWAGRRHEKHLSEVGGSRNNSPVGLKTKAL